MNKFIDLLKGKCECTQIGLLILRSSTWLFFNCKPWMEENHKSRKVERSW